MLQIEPDRLGAPSGTDQSMDDQEEIEVEVQEGDILDGKYRVEKILGAGGMGVVVSAQHTVLNNRVALKFLLPSVAKNEHTAARFLREAQAAVRIKSPHVARVIDVGTMADSGSPYMVMEYLEGRDLGEVLETQGALEVDLAAHYALQACEALAAAHSCGIVHRDIKPANLFLTVAGDGSPVVKVLDFGISKNVVEMGISNLTQTQTAMGSPLYMSPEQMRSARDVDARTDIWSIGVVLFESLTGQLPFMAETMPQLCALVLEEDAPRVTSLNSDVPEALADVVERCLKKRREDRYDDIAQVAKAIAAVYPDWALPAAERCSRILAGAGMNTTVSQFEAPRPTMTSKLPEATEPPSEPPPTSQLGGTETAFGRTGADAPAPEPSKSRPVVIAAVAAVVIGGVLFIMTRAPEQGVSAASSSPGPSAAAASLSVSSAEQRDKDPKPTLELEPEPATADAETNEQELGEAPASDSASPAATTEVAAASASAAPAKPPPKWRPPAGSKSPKPRNKPAKPPEKKPDPFGDRF